ncbi:MAG: recombination mediator RecR [Sphingomonadales bacterium]
MSSNPRKIEQLIQHLSKMPGLGPRSARRAVLQIIKKRESYMVPLAKLLKEVAAEIVTCKVCGNLDTSSPCQVCENPKRDPSLICVVEDVSDLWALERTASYKGLYHVLGGTLSALNGTRPEDLNIDSLIRRSKGEKVKEIILATNATVDGQTTAHYIVERLRGAKLKISAIAHGVPVGGELDYLDDGTLSAALKERKQY